MELTGKKYFSATRVAVIALFSALAGVLYIFNFPMPFAFPGFLEFHFSDIPALIGTFALGPLSGGIIVFVKILIKLAVQSTSTSFVGDFADLLIGLAYVLPAGLIYKKKRTFRGALLGVSVGTVVSVVVSVVANRLVLVPFYVQFFFGGSWDPLIGMMTPLFASCTRETFYDFYLWASVLPFNLLRCAVAAAVTMLVYKRISNAINRVNEKLSARGRKGAAKEKQTAAPLVIGCVAAVVVLLAVVLVRFFLGK